MNPNLHLPRFVKRRVDRILLVASADAWSYVNRSLNPADVERAWKVLNGLVVTHSGLTDPTFCCRKTWSLSLTFP